MRAWKCVGSWIPSQASKADVSLLCPYTHGFNCRPMKGRSIGAWNMQEQEGQDRQAGPDPCRAELLVPGAHSEAKAHSSHQPHPRHVQKQEGQKFSACDHQALTSWFSIYGTYLLWYWLKTIAKHYIHTWIVRQLLFSLEFNHFVLPLELPTFWEGEKVTFMFL